MASTNPEMKDDRIRPDLIVEGIEKFLVRPVSGVDSRL